MHPEDKQPFLGYLDKKIIEVDGRVKESEHARNTADGKMKSRYDTQQESYALEASIGLGILETLQSAYTEIQKAPLRFKVELGADVDVILNGQPQRLLVLKTHIELPGVTVVSLGSPIGKSISGKIAGDHASYTMGSQRFSVEIRSIL